SRRASLPRFQPRPPRAARCHRRVRRRLPPLPRRRHRSRDLDARARPRAPRRPPRGAAMTDARERVDPTMLVGVGGVTELVLVRHGKQAISDEFLDVPVDELLDPPLSDLGRRQAEALARELARDRVDAVYSSTS